MHIPVYDALIYPEHGVVWRYIPSTEWSGKKTQSAEWSGESPSAEWSGEKSQSTEWSGEKSQSTSVVWRVVGRS